ncbi:MAG: EthD domain-containing protein [Myxococcota bacterium]|nr:EthD domain-containing protein [Myxococcota bacterium]
MEKLVYVLWPEAGQAAADFALRARSELAAQLIELGCRGLALSLVDEDAEAVQGSRLTKMETPIAGLASFWLESAEDRGPHEERLEAACGRIAGYAVSESVPLLPEWKAGTRIPGIDMVALLQRPERIEPAEWLHRWLDHHRVVALETQATFLYVRNVVVRALTEGAPPYAGIVEEGFATEAIGNPAKWYDAEGDPKKLEANVSRMIESCKAFLDLGAVESHPTSLFAIQDRP